MSGGARTIRRRVHFSGHVQGVGFRYTTRRIAGGYAIDGFVRNLPDGRVELVAEGSPEDVQSFLDEVQAEMGSHIREVQAVEEPATGEFSGFLVRH